MFDTLPRGIQSLCECPAPPAPPASHVLTSPPCSFFFAALIEGLVGSSSEISNVFEIEDEINQDWSESDTDTDGFDSAEDEEEGGGGDGEDEPKAAATASDLLDHPVFSPGTLSPEQLSPASEHARAASTPPSAPGAAETPRRVAFPPSVNKTPSSVGIPSPRKRIDSLDGLNRVKPSPLAQIYSNKLSASHQPSALSSSSAAGPRGLHRRSASSSAHDGATHRRTFSQSNAARAPPPSTIPEGRVAFEREPSPAPARSLPASASNLTQRLAAQSTSTTAAAGGPSAASGASCPADGIGKASDVLENGDVGIVDGQIASRVQEVEQRMARMTDLLERILDRLPVPADSRRGSADAPAHDSGDGWSQPLRPSTALAAAR